MTPICPDIPDNWSGGRSETARLLGIDPKTLDKFAALGPKRRGIGYTVGKSGKKKFSGREIKRFWREF